MTVELSPGLLLAGKYRIERELGSGAMGAVFLAENVDLGRRVAIKVLHPQAAAHVEVLARFRQEARAAAAIGHPGIVDVLDLGRTAEGAEFIVMEHLRGETLGQRLERETRLDVSAVLEIARALADALAAAHDHGIVHRDLKPDNVFLVQEPAPAIKIVDFGISKLTRAKERAVQTATGAVLGTPMYMSPEQVSSDRELGPAADLYALGAICYQMLGGRPPFLSGSWAHLLLQIVNEAPAPLESLRPGLPPALCRLVMQLLAKTPSGRPGSAEEVRRRLDELRSQPADPAALADTAMPVGGAADPAALADTATAAGQKEATAALADTAASPLGAVADTMAAPAPAPPLAAAGTAAAEAARASARRLVPLGLAAAVLLAGIPTAIYLLRSPVAPVVVSVDASPARPEPRPPPSDVGVDIRADLGAPDLPRRRRPAAKRRPRAADAGRRWAPHDPLRPLPPVRFPDAATGAGR